jgi:hypothetical protein
MMTSEEAQAILADRGFVDSSGHILRGIPLCCVDEVNYGGRSPHVKCRACDEVIYLTACVICPEPGWEIEPWPVVK